MRIGCIARESSRVRKFDEKVKRRDIARVKEHAPCGTGRLLGLKRLATALILAESRMSYIVDYFRMLFTHQPRRGRATVKS